jgi:hypothetical protein
MRGEMTRATGERRPDVAAPAPGASTSAGNWKQSDLPPPVGRTTSESRRSITASMASRWSGLNEV